MLFQIFSVHDVKSDLYAAPFFMPATGQAVRAFKDLVNDPQSTVSKHPKDFRLVCIGTYNDEDATFVGQKPVSLGFGEDYIPVREAGNGA